MPNITNTRSFQPERPLSDDRVLAFLRLLWALDHQLQRASKRMTRELGVTGPQRLTVRLIATSPGITPSELAAALHLHKSTVTGILERLETHGVIRRTIDPRDGRRARLYLTAKGRRISQTRGRTIEQTVREALSEVSPQVLASAASMLTLVATELERTFRA